MNRWLIKTEPGDYSAQDLERERRTLWTGVHNPVALRHLRAMATGDELFVYHTGKEKAIVATGRVAGPPAPDPKDSASAMVEVEFAGWLARSVPLKEIKADNFFADFDLVRLSRLSVMPVSEGQWMRLVKMAANPAPS
jgi:predicted RNA-binding protein with PUA-like domain